MCSPALQEGWQPPAAECAALIRPFQGRATKRLLLPLFAVAVQSLSGQDVPRLQARADSLVREWRRASALADMVDSLDHARAARSEEHTSELQSRLHLVCRLLLEKKKKISRTYAK